MGAHIVKQNIDNDRLYEVLGVQLCGGCVMDMHDTLCDICS